MEQPKPLFFDEVRKAAESRWDQLEADPELAGPWHQLFKQVQSPRHVLSELLQNADDAGATETKAWIQDETFFFEHNGTDFSQENFLSLCRFGYSNKRSLHTIGFRGIGFKSTFSLGPTVNVSTPTLSFLFRRTRFTQPHWVDSPLASRAKTIISVTIEDQYRLAELQKNLKEWEESPVSLLFFRNIKCLFINGIELRWIAEGNGFCPGSQVLSLVGDDDTRCYLIRSELEEFPEESIDEIRQERLVGDDSDFSLPPCQVEIIVGASPGLYVVLPTSVKPNIPFACNAPFMQDPARVKIKDPETSPTNRWLLERVGKLSAIAMHQWLSNLEIGPIDRAEAYRLWIGTSNSQRGTDAACSDVIGGSFLDGIKDLPVALTQQGTLEGRGSCVYLEKQLQHIWPPEIFSNHIEPSNKKPLCEHIHHDAAMALCASGYAERITRSRFCLLLDERNPPRPEFDCLLRLWVYLYPEVVDYRGPKKLDELPIVPVAGQDVLFQSKEVSRLGQWHSRLSDASKQLISGHLICICDSWLDFLSSEENDYVADRGRWSSQTALEMASRMLSAMGLSEKTDTRLVASKMAKHILKTDSTDESKIIQLAHMCSEIDCAVPPSFPYQTCSSSLRQVSEGVCVPWSYNSKSLYPDATSLKYCISDAYSSDLTDKPLERWHKWSASSLSGLLHLPPLSMKEKYLGTARQLQQYLMDSFGVTFDLERLPYSWQSAYSSQYYRVIDYDIDEDVLQHWVSLGSIDEALKEVMECILDGALDEWFKTPSLRLYQTTTNGRTEQEVSHPAITASWLSRFQQSPCIPDTRGNFYMPSQLLRRSIETMPFVDVERFIDERLDTKFNSKILQLLGVSGQQPGPDLILKLLESLSNLGKSAFAEAKRLYEQLDKSFAHLSDDQKESIIQVFEDSPIVLTDQGFWLHSSEVFISTEGLQIDGMQTVIESVQHLGLWRHLGLNERINESAAIKVIHSYQPNSNISHASIDVIKALLRRFPESILHSCSVWIGLDSTLKQLADCQFCTQSPEFDAANLYDSIKAVTIDLAFLDSASKAVVAKIVDLPRLESFLNYEPELAGEIDEPSNESPKWIQAVGSCLARVVLDDSVAQSDLYDFGLRLGRSRIAYADKISVIPFLQGAPVGFPIEKDGAFVDTRIIVKKLSPSRLASLIPSVISEYLHLTSLKNAICYCYDRSAKSIAGYFEANFSLQGTANLDEVYDAKADSSSIQDSSVEPHGNKYGSLTSSFKSTADLDSTVQGDGSEDLVRGRETEVGSVLENLLSKAWPDSNDQSNPVDVNGSEVHSPKNISGNLDEPAGSMNAGLELVARFAASLDMKRDSAGAVYVDRAGRTLSRQHGELFPWVLKDSHGLPLHQYQCSVQSILAAAFELSHEALGLIREFPDAYSIISVNASNELLLVDGYALDSMIKSGSIKVFPSSYRLVPQ